MSKYTITEIKATEVLDNRGMPTIRAYACVNEKWAWADVPKGSSVGSYEVFDLRDGEKRYKGEGVKKAISNIENIIAPALKGVDATFIQNVDRIMLELDGTRNKSKLGGNAILGVSLAVAKASAKSLGLPLYRYLNPFGHILPVPQTCMINGGVHAGNDLEVQEICVMPVGVSSFSDAMEALNAIWYSLKEVLEKELGKGASNTGEDGGYAPPVGSLYKAMDYVMEAVRKSGLEKEIFYGLDMASSGYYDLKKKKYIFQGKEMTREDILEYYEKFLKDYPKIVSLEDPLEENDVEGWALMTEMFSDRIMLIGDDFLATNPERLKLAINNKAVTGLLCKVNQIGSISETFEVATLAQRNKISLVMSPRSGETEDSILSDISLALNAGCYKTGGLRGSDRGSNYNRFIEIEKELGKVAKYASYDYKHLL